MNDDAYDKIYLIKNWALAGVPPKSAAWQYAQLWHICLAPLSVGRSAGFSGHRMGVRVRGVRPEEEPGFARISGEG